MNVWLRVTPVGSDKAIVVDNPTSDARINTSDVLAVMENFVSGQQFAIIAMGSD